MTSNRPPKPSTSPRNQLQLRPVVIAVAVAVALLIVGHLEHAIYLFRGEPTAQSAEIVALFAAATAIPFLGFAVLHWHRLRVDVEEEMDELRCRRRDEATDHGKRTLRRERIKAVLDAGDTVSMVFQPIVELRGPTVIGHEALARFSAGGSPQEWFAEARAVGLGVELEMVAISRAAREFVGPGYLSLNLSPDTITSPAFLEFLSHRPATQMIVVELTEHAVIEDYEQIRAAVARVRNLGVRIAVDDAGAGASSMQHILAIGPEIIKLDRSIIAGLDGDEARRALVKSLAGFACSIGADMIAEGIETRGELDACVSVGIRYGQGYFLGRPNPVDGLGQVSVSIDGSS